MSGRVKGELFTFFNLNFIISALKLDLIFVEEKRRNCMKLHVVKVVDEWLGLP
jgi:hypothetical protein